jgi:hypothetical protein
MPGFVRLLVQMINALGVEQRGAAPDVMHRVTLFEQGLRKVSAVLAGHADDQRHLALPVHFGRFNIQGLITKILGPRF